MVTFWTYAGESGTTLIWPKVLQEHSVILLTFIKLPFVIKISVLSIFLSD